MKEIVGRDLSVGGPTLAAQALAAGLVDDCHLFLVPVTVGGGLRALPPGVGPGLELAGSAASPAGWCTCTTASPAEGTPPGAAYRPASRVRRRSAIASRLVLPTPTAGVSWKARPSLHASTRYVPSSCRNASPRR